MVLVLDLVEQKYFNYSQIYVALSPAISLVSLTIVGDFRKEFVKAHTEIVKEYVRLRNDSNALIYNGGHPKQKFDLFVNG